MRLDAFVRQEQAIAVLKAVSEIFREADVLRENRERARLKYLFLRHGWTAQSFLQELEKRLGFRLELAGAEHVPADVFRDHAGIHPQKAAGAVLCRRFSASRPHHARTDACGCRSCRAAWQR